MILMDDIFYMTDKKVNINDIAGIAQETNAINVFIPESAEVMQIEYKENIMADWSCMRIGDFQESEDKIFLDQNKIKSVFCISCHMNNFTFMLPHVKMLLQKYGGFIGSDSDGFQPCFSQENIVYFTLSDYEIL